MKRALLICCFALTAVLLNAQKIYFVYLQNESREPFFVRVSDQLYSSTASGYLILPRLKDSSYNLKLGFPGKNMDIDFSISINKKDRGFLIKNLGEKGWGLFDLQSMSLQMSSSNAKVANQLSYNSSVQVNAFTDLLAKAADDPSLKQSPILVKEEEKKVEPIQTVQKQDKNPEVTDAVVKEEKKSEIPLQPVNKPEEKKTDAIRANERRADSAQKTVAKTEEIYRKSQVVRISGVATIEGFESVFADEYQNGSKDTVRILIPAGHKETVNTQESKADSTRGDKKFLDINPDTTLVIQRPPETKKEETKKWWPFNKNKGEADDKSQPEEKKQEGKRWWPFNKNNAETAEIKKCQAVAGNDDFLKLRRRMAGRTNDDGMLDEARKYFKEKCFSTEQIKNLSSMFLSNAGKYNFFDAAYNHVSDKENFSSLQSELKDEYYVNRFKETFQK